MNPFVDFSYTSYMLLRFVDFKAEAPSLMTCTNAETVLRNWLWSHLYERLKASHSSDVVPEDMIEDGSMTVAWVNRFNELQSHPSNPFDASATCDTYAMYTDSNDGVGSYVMQCAPSNTDFTSSDSLAETGQRLVKAFTKTRSFYSAGHGSSAY